MKWLLLVLPPFLLSCGGTLSDEQRKNMREQMEAHRIKKISPSEILDAALEKGKLVVASVQDFPNDSSKIDSLMKTVAVVEWIPFSQRSAHPTARQVQDAYMDADPNHLKENVQEIRSASGISDTILYTKPVIEKIGKDSARLSGIWNVWMLKRDLVLSIKQE